MTLFRPLPGTIRRIKMKKQSALVAALMLGAAIPSFAQDGFRVGIQLGSMKTTGDSAALATDVNGSSTPGTYHTINFDQPTQSPLSLDLAWVKGDDEWSLTYFSTKKKVNGTEIDTASGHTVGIGSSFLVTGAGVTGSNELKATLIDLSWKRTLVKSDKGTFAFSAGLRYSKQSDERTLQQVDAASNPTGLSVHEKGEGKGFGLTAGVHGRMNFTDRMWLTTGFTAGLINNTDKTGDYTIGSGGSPALVISADDVHQSLLQTDAYLRFNMNFVSTFNGYLGYEVRDFNKNGARTQGTPYFADLYGFGNTSGFGLAGLTLGLSYTF